MTEIGLSDGSRVHVSRPADHVRTRIAQVMQGVPGDASGMWVDVGAGMHLNPAHIVYVKDQDEPSQGQTHADRADA